MINNIIYFKRLK